MKKKSLTSICGTVVLAAFFACSNEVPGELENSGLTPNTKATGTSELVEMADGVLKFRDADALSDAMVNPEFVNAAKLKANNSNFKSLGNKYVELEKSYELMVVNQDIDGEESIMDDFIENRVESRTLADFLNEDGIMIVGDLAVKVIGEYAYSLSSDNYNELSQLTEEELQVSENVAVNRIIVPLVSDDSAIQTKGSSGGTYERSPVFILTNDKGRREHVKFNPYLFVVPKAQTEIVIEMEGRAQTKQFLGYWGNTFSDEMVWGEIHLISGSWYYNQPPAGGLPIPQGTNYFTPGLKSRTTGVKFCGWAQRLGNSEGVSNVKATITYKAKKNMHQPADWAGEYTNNYTSITK